jgi:hypothetical protein
VPTRQSWLRRLTVCHVCACIPCGVDRPGVARSCVASAAAVVMPGHRCFQRSSTCFAFTLLYQLLVAQQREVFSALRRLKTYLRSTVTQKRLNHLAALHFHREQPVDFEEICNSFIQRNEMRQVTFAVFPE